MIKLQDPTAPYAGVIPRRRRERMGEADEVFRFGGRAPKARPSSGTVAVVGASASALSPESIEETAAHLGALGGVLADLGYDVFAVSALSELDTRPTFIGWVGGAETAEERDQLASLDVPGLVIGARLDGFDAWASVEPDDHRDSFEFVRAAFTEIRGLTDGQDGLGTASAGGSTSTVSSTVRPGRGVYGTARTGYDQPRNPSSGSRSVTGWDRTKRRPTGS